MYLVKGHKIFGNGLVSGKGSSQCLPSVHDEIFTYVMPEISWSVTV